MGLGKGGEWMEMKVNKEDRYEKKHEEQNTARRRRRRLGRGGGGGVGWGERRHKEWARRGVRG